MFPKKRLLRPQARGLSDPVPKSFGYFSEAPSLEGDRARHCVSCSSQKTVPDTAYRARLKRPCPTRRIVLVSKDRARHCVSCSSPALRAASPHYLREKGIVNVSMVLIYRPLDFRQNGPSPPPAVIHYPRIGGTSRRQRQIFKVFCRALPVRQGRKTAQFSADEPSGNLKKCIPEAILYYLFGSQNKRSCGTVF